MPATTRAGLGRSQEPGTPSGPPQVQGLKHGDHHLLLPQAHEQGAESEVQQPGLKAASTGDAVTTGNSFIPCAVLTPSYVHFQMEV